MALAAFAGCGGEPLGGHQPGATGGSGLTPTDTSFGTGTGGDTVFIAEDPTDGWTFTDSTLTSVTFNGLSCTDERDGTDRQVSILYTCPGPPLLLP